MPLGRILGLALSMLRRVFVLLIGICLSPLSQAQVVLYATSGNGNQSSLYTVNPLTAQATLVGPVMAGTQQLTITGMAVHPTTGVLFGITGSENFPQRQLATINPITAQAVLIGSLGPTSSTGASDISFAADGTLYAWTTRGGPLATINLTTGLRTSVGTAANGTQSNGLTFTPGGTLFLAGPETGSLYTVDTTTGAITVVAPLSGAPVGLGAINAMASDPNGVIYAVGRSSGHQLVTINPSTGVMTTIGTLPFESDAIVFATAIPEPSTWAMIALGLVVGGFALRRRP